MAATFTYTQACTFPYYGSNVFFPTTSPPPGLQPSSISVSQDVAVNTINSVVLLNVGGSQPGSGTVSCQVPANGTACGGTNTTWIPSGTSGVQIRVTSGGVGSSGTYTINFTVSITYNDAAPPAPCIYGTQPGTGAAAMTLITSAAVDAACALWGAPWLAIIFDPLIGQVIDSGILCGTGPPSVSTITPQSLLETIGQKMQLLQSLMWYSVCQCTPAPTGSPPPTPYPVPTPTMPVGWPSRPSYSCSNSDICTTLEYILKRLDELNTSQNINVNQRTTIQNAPLPFAYQNGASHAGLVGSGTISVSTDVGVRMQCTTLPPGYTIPANPPYYWDVGWMSVSDGGAMLQEHRVTRTSEEWFPVDMNLATVFGYYLSAGVVATMTELIPA